MRNLLRKCHRGNLHIAMSNRLIREFIREQVRNMMLETVGKPLTFQEVSREFPIAAAGVDHLQLFGIVRKPHTFVLVNGKLHAFGKDRKKKDVEVIWDSEESYWHGTYDGSHTRDLSFDEMRTQYPVALDACIYDESMMRVGEDRASSKDMLATRTVKQGWKFWIDEDTGELCSKDPRDSKTNDDSFADGRDRPGVWNKRGKCWDF